MFSGSPSAAAQHSGLANQQRTRAGSGEVTLEADQQRKTGGIFYADGNADVVYGTIRLRADHLEYNDETKTALARGHVRFDHETQHLEASDGSYNLLSGRGVFHHVRGTFAIQRRTSPTLLISPNPIYFQAEEIERLDADTYKLRRATVTVCNPPHPKWKFHAPVATIRLDRSIRLEGASFDLFSIPVLYLPYATAPAGRRVRQSGFLIPDVGQSTTKGFVLGDAFYWAPTDWADATVGAQLLSKRGFSLSDEARLRPWEKATLAASYFDVHDRGLPGQGSQGGHEYHLGFDALLPAGWHAVADLNGLSSLVFRLAFASTFAEAANSEVRNTAFLNKDFSGFSLNFAALGYKNFFSATPQTFVFLRTAPEVRFSSVDQAPWRNLPVYLGFQAFADAVHRENGAPPILETPEFISRDELAPRIAIPLHWGPWLGVTPSFTLRSTRYSGQLQNQVFTDQPLIRTTEEFSADLRPPYWERVWEGATKWKHTIEPEITYRYVTGVNDFGRFLRFDEDETLTDTNEVQYDLTQHLFRRESDGDADELISWRIAQKYYFDPTFGGAIVPGQRNVFQALDALTPFAFAQSSRNFSPIVSDLRIAPGGRYDAQFRADFDPKRGQLTATGALLKLRPYKESFLTLAHFSVINLPSSAAQLALPLPSRENQIRALAGYGDINRRGWNGALGFSYDFTQATFQNEIAQLTYNGSCCGIGFEYRRLELANVRVENQYRVVLLIANVGSAGNLRRQEKIF